jgi:Icc-related predicted phosphoesterase
MFEEIKNVIWYFPPTKNRVGKSRKDFDTKSIILVTTDIVNGPTIVTSDLHSHTQSVFNKLDEYVQLDRFTVICAGDMAGAQIFGSDGDPTNYYEYMLSKCGELYFVQGNHDLPSNDGLHREKQLHNKYATFGTDNQCSLDGHVFKSSIGKIGGIDGIISDKNHDYKMGEDDYLHKLGKVLGKKPHILVTHDTPMLPIKTDKAENYVGNEKIYKLVSKSSHKIHIYGHCHHPKYYNFIEGINYICADARVIIMIPRDNYMDFLKQELQEEYCL